MAHFDVPTAHVPRRESAEHAIRERQERELEILRGLGELPSAADMRAMGDELQWAAVEDGTRCERCGRSSLGGVDAACRHCGYEDEFARQLRGEHERLNAEAAAEFE